MNTIRLPRKKRLEITEYLLLNASAIPRAVLLHQRWDNPRSSDAFDEKAPHLLCWVAYWIAHGRYPAAMPCDVCMTGLGDGIFDQYFTYWLENFNGSRAGLSCDQSELLKAYVRKLLIERL